MIISYILNKGAELLGKKWRTVVIWHLRYGPMRFSELKRKIPEVSVKVLSEVLQEMEQKGMIIRTQYNTIPVKVTYSIDPKAQEFVDVYTHTTLVMAKYLIRNKKALDIPSDIVNEINEFLEAYEETLAKKN